MHLRPPTTAHAARALADDEVYRIRRVRGATNQVAINLRSLIGNRSTTVRRAEQRPMKNMTLATNSAAVGGRRRQTRCAVDGLTMTPSSIANRPPQLLARLPLATRSSLFVRGTGMWPEVYLTLKRRLCVVSVALKSQRDVCRLTCRVCRAARAAQTVQKRAYGGGGRSC